MDPSDIKLPPQGRRRGRYSDEFKGRLIEACQQPGVSTAAVALANGINANLLRRWVTQTGAQASDTLTPIADTTSVASFVRLPGTLPQEHPQASSTVRIEVRRGETSVVLHWPTHQPEQCAALLGAILR